MVNHEKKKIFVTGASSFVGCHLVKGISQASEWEVTPIGRKNPEDYKAQAFRRVEFGGEKNNWTVLSCSALCNSYVLLDDSSDEEAAITSRGCWLGLQ